MRIGVVRRAGPSKSAGKTSSLERLEHLRVAEELVTLMRMSSCSARQLRGMSRSSCDVGLEARRRSARAIRRASRRRMVAACSSPSRRPSLASSGRACAEIGAAVDEPCVAAGSGAAERVGGAGDPRQLARDARRRKHEVHGARGDRAARHPGVLRGLLVLREGDAAARLLIAMSPLAPSEPVPERTTPIAMLPSLGERAEEVVDRASARRALGRAASGAGCRP